jgi:hypothetical protein
MEPVFNVQHGVEKSGYENKAGDIWRRNLERILQIFTYIGIYISLDFLFNSIKLF